MQRKLAGIFAVWVSFTSVAVAEHACSPPLDRIVYQASAEHWVSTDTATVSVGINATVDKQGLVQTRQQLMANLNRIAPADWRITQFNRRQDSSGLEQVDVSAEARVGQGALANLREQANTVSKPGAKYQIIDIAFTPELADIEAVRSTVRESLYTAINSEVERLNKRYPEQQYRVHRIDFTGMPGLQLRARQGAEMMAMAAPAADINVSNRVMMTATVVIAASRHVDKD